MKMLIKSVTGTGLPLPGSLARQKFCFHLRHGSAHSVVFSIDVLFIAVSASKEQDAMPRTENSP